MKTPAQVSQKWTPSTSTIDEKEPSDVVGSPSEDSQGISPSASSNVVDSMCEIPCEPTDVARSLSFTLSAPSMPCEPAAIDEYLNGTRSNVVALELQIKSLHQKVLSLEKRYSKVHSQKHRTSVLLERATLDLALQNKENKALRKQVLKLSRVGKLNWKEEMKKLQSGLTSENITSLIIELAKKNQAAINEIALWQRDNILKIERDAQREKDKSWFSRLRQMITLEVVGVSRSEHQKLRSMRNDTQIHPNKTGIYICFILCISYLLHVASNPFIIGDVQVRNVFKPSANVNSLISVPDCAETKRLYLMQLPAFNVKANLHSLQFDIETRHSCFVNPVAAAVEVFKLQASSPITEAISSTTLASSRRAIIASCIASMSSPSSSTRFR